MSVQQLKCEKISAFLYNRQKTVSQSEPLVKLLQTSEYFRNLNISQEDDLREIAFLLHHCIVGPNELVVEIGDTSEVFFVLFDGVCDLLSLQQDNQQQNPAIT